MEKKKKHGTLFRMQCIEFCGILKNLFEKPLFNAYWLRMETQARWALKVHYLHSHIDNFLAQLVAYSVELGKSLHWNVNAIKRRYQGRWDVNILADYCWMLRWETQDGKRKCVRRSSKRRRKNFGKKRNLVLNILWRKTFLFLVYNYKKNPAYYIVIKLWFI